LVLSSALVLGVGIAWAAENPSRDAGRLHIITVIDPGLVFPASLKMGQGERVEFANYYSEAIRLVFVEPNDSAEKVRCSLPKKTDATAGGDTVRGRADFTSDPSQHLTVTIPPGRYASACSLTPGRYAFVTQRVGRDPRAPLDMFGQKATISVE
jgi:hypothetical protein